MAPKIILCNDVLFNNLYLYTIDPHSYRRMASFIVSENPPFGDKSEGNIYEHISYINKSCNDYTLSQRLNTSQLMCTWSIVTAKYNVHYIMYMHYTLYIIHCTLYNVQCTMYIVHCTHLYIRVVCEIHVAYPLQKVRVTLKC